MVSDSDYTEIRPIHRDSNMNNFSFFSKSKDSSCLRIMTSPRTVLEEKFLCEWALYRTYTWSHLTTVILLTIITRASAVGLYSRSTLCLKWTSCSSRWLHGSTISSSCAEGRADDEATENCCSHSWRTCCNTSSGSLLLFGQCLVHTRPPT